MNSKMLVLSDELLKEFYNFKHNKKFNNQIVEKLLHFYKIHITNIEQLKRIGVIDSSLFQSLSQNNLISQTLEELSKITIFKIILNTVKDKYPYLNIKKDKLENNITSTYKKQEIRNKSREYIKELLSGAKYIFIYDLYIMNNWNTTKRFFDELIPKKSLTIFYTDNHLKQNDISKIKQIYKWTIKEDTTNKQISNLHDRYLIIDNKIEIILTSGFDYLFDESKDFTYIMRMKD